MIGSNNIQNNEVICRKPTVKSIKFCQQGNIKTKLCRKHLKSNDWFTFTTKPTFKIYHESNCSHRNVIYLLLESIRSHIRYHRKLELLFYFTSNSYRHKKKSMDQNNLIFVEQHFPTNSNDFNEEAKSTLIKTEKDSNMKSIIEKKRRQLNKKSENICAIWIWYET